MMCERAAVARKTQGGVLADKQSVQDYMADSYIQLIQFRLLRAVRGVGDRPVPGLPQGSASDIAAIKVLTPQVLHDVVPAVHPGPRRPRGLQRDAPGRHVDGGPDHGAGRRAHRGPPGHGGPPGAEALPAGARAVAHRAPAREAGRGAGRSSPSTSSTKWATCERDRRRRRGATTEARRATLHHRPRARWADWMDERDLPGAGAAPHRPFITGGASNELFEITPGRPPHGPAPPAPVGAPGPQRDHAARVPAAGRPGRTPTSPTPGCWPCCDDPRADGGLLLPDGVRRRLVAHPERRRVARAVRHRPRGPAGPGLRAGRRDRQAVQGGLGGHGASRASAGPTASTSARSTAG